jgi:hypothetical protein
MGLVLEGQDPATGVAGADPSRRQSPRQPARPTIRPRQPAAANWPAVPANRAFQLGCGPEAGGEVPGMPETGDLNGGTGNRERKAAGNRVARNGTAAPDAVTFTLYVPEPHRCPIVVVGLACGYSIDVPWLLC